MSRNNRPARQTFGRLSLEQLETREVPAWFAVGLLSPASGDVGDSAATFSGGLTLNPDLPTRYGKVFVDAPNETVAIQAALVNSITASLGGLSANYTPDNDAVGSSTSTHLPFVISPGISSGQYELRLEDLASMPGQSPDWDYNDRVWKITVTHVDDGPLGVVGVGGQVWVEMGTPDGIRQDVEPFRGGVKVKLFKADGTQVGDEQTTDQNGNYSWLGVPTGVPLYVQFTSQPGYRYTAQNVGSDTTRDSDANPSTGKTPQFTLSPGQGKSNLDAGLVRTYTDLSVGTISGPAVVPGNSQYRYIAVIGGDATASNSIGWRLTDTTGQVTLDVGGREYDAATNKTVITATLTFKNEAPSKFKLQVYNVASQQTLADRELILVQVIVTDIAPSFTYSTPSHVTPAVIQPTGQTIPGAAQFLSFTPSTDPDYTNWQAQVQFVGPGQNEGVDKIKAGIIQRGKVRMLKAEYGSGKWLLNSMDNQSAYYLDRAQGPYDPLNPYYIGGYVNAVGQQKSGITALAAGPPGSNTIFTLSGKDGPNFMLPITQEQEFGDNFRTGFAGGTNFTWLTKTYVYVEFKLDVAAQTLDPTDDANRFFWSQANADWTFNGNGTASVSTTQLVDGLPTVSWTADANRTIVPSAWTITTGPHSVELIGPTLNEQGAKAKFSIPPAP
ncbi:MAG: hypothetical protein MUF18_08315 [Fimbriiglobus sp.]|jgi:hypothetical protein|nr:hypothetical protein [Fimbriiglobus sp.]